MLDDRIPIVREPGRQLIYKLIKVCAITLWRTNIPGITLPNVPIFSTFPYLRHVVGSHAKSRSYVKRIA